MIFGKNKTQNPTPLNPPESIIFDATTEDFETTVMRASMDKPVIVDFWAPWCAPCKQLMPILESAVNAAGGEVLLAKVNLDENPELAQALRVQSVPTVYGFIGGQPVDAFQGVVPENQIKAFINKLIQASRAARPGAIDITETLEKANQALSSNDLSSANSFFMQVLEQDDTNAKAFAGLVRVFLAAYELEQAEQLLNNIPEEMKNDPAITEVRTALTLAQNAPKDDELEALEKAVTQNPNDHQAKIEYAEALFAIGQKERAIELLIESIRQDQNWNEAAARTTLIKFFEALGHGDPLSVQGRKKLRNILFS